MFRGYQPQTMQILPSGPLQLQMVGTLTDS